MGGVIILMAVLLPTLLLSKLNSPLVQIIIFSTVWMGLIGFIDDYLKVVKKVERGLIARYKIAGQVTLGCLISLWIFQVPEFIEFNTKTTVPFFKNVEISKALESVSDIVSSTNKYIDDMKPWSLAKEGKLNDLKIVLKASLEMIRIISILFYPVMPDSSEKILNALNISLDSEKSSFTGENQIAPLAVNKKIGELNLLFPKIDKIEG